MALRLLLLLFVGLWGSAPAAGVESEPAPVRVGTSGDYAPFSTMEPGRPPRWDGLDVALARAWAADRGREVVFVPFRWPELLGDLAADRFDVAMSGVTVRPERSTAGRFGIPVVETGAVVLARDPDRWSELRQLDRPSVRIGVNAGGHLERVARARFPRATLLAIPDNAAVLGALVDEAVDAVVTDTAEAERWQEAAGGDSAVERLGPFTRDRKAWLVTASDAALAADLDTWLVAREADGTLARLRRAWMPGGEGAAVAHPLAALMAALDERLSLMPWIGRVKRRDGLPLEVPERETVVLEAATSAALAAAAAADVRPPSVLEIRGFFRAQMEAAKQVQRDAVRDTAAPASATLPDLDGALRPALLRIGEKIAWLLVRLPSDLDRATIRAAADDGLRAPYLSNASRRALADAVADYVDGMPSPQAPSD